ncbi:MAG: cell division protein SepF [Lachnospiraceae bacterium]|nr:cell division protein SepF [Lachnospiraceae bacterium]
MSLLSKLISSMRLSGGDDEDDYYLDDDDSFEDELPRKGFFSKRTDDDEYEEEMDNRSRFLGSRNNNSKVVPMRRSMEVTMIKPTSMEDSSEVCDYLLAGKAVVLNLEGIHMEIAQRIIDFTSGATYSIGGNLQKISNYIFIATPQSVELSGDFQDLLSGGNLGGVSGMNIRL